MRIRRLAPLCALGLLLLAGCTGDPAPTPKPSETPVDETVQSQIEGEWVLTRTVTETDDADNPASAVGAVSTRAVLFGDVVCTGGPCTGGVLSGPTSDVRDATDFSSAGDVIRYTFTGNLNCLRQDTKAVLLTNGFTYTATVELRVTATGADAADDGTEGAEDEAAPGPGVATALEGTMTYTDTITDEAIEAGCARTPATTTTVYSITGVRAEAAAPAA